MKLQLSYGFNDDIKFQEAGYKFLGKASTGQKNKDLHVWQTDDESFTPDSELETLNAIKKEKESQIKNLEERHQELLEKNKNLEEQCKNNEDRLELLKEDIRAKHKKIQKIQKEAQEKIRAKKQQVSLERDKKEITALTEQIKTLQEKLKLKENKTDKSLPEIVIKKVSLDKDIEEIKSLRSELKVTKAQLKALKEHTEEQQLNLKEEIEDLKSIKLPKYSGFDKDLKALIKLYLSEDSEPHDQILASYIKNIVNTFNATINKIIRISQSMK